MGKKIYKPRVIMERVRYMDGALCSGEVERSLIYIFLALNIDRFSNFLPVEMLKCIGSPNKVVSRCRVLVYSF